MEIEFDLFEIDLDEAESGEHWLKKYRPDMEVPPDVFRSLRKSECGAGEEGNPGFQPGNTCASGGGSNGVGEGFSDDPTLVEEFGTIVEADFKDVVDRDGQASIVGYQVKGPRDLAAVAQVFRDERYETFRAFFVKDGVIVGMNAYTSGAPDLVLIPENIAKHIVSDADNLNADGYYLLHNHPSGDATPSPGDLSITESFADLDDRLLAHVVIDTDEAGIIKMNSGAARYDVIEVESIAYPDPTEDIRRDVLGKSIVGSREFAEIASSVRPWHNDQFALIITDVKLEIVGLLHLPTAIIPDLIANKDTDATKAVAAFMRSVGGGSSYRFAVFNEGATRKITGLRESNLFTDYVESLWTNDTVRVIPGSGNLRSDRWWINKVGIKPKMVKKDRIKSLSKSECGAGEDGNPGFQRGNTCAASSGTNKAVYDKYVRVIKGRHAQSLKDAKRRVLIAEKKLDDIIGSPEYKEFLKLKKARDEYYHELHKAYIRLSGGSPNGDPAVDKAMADSLFASHDNETRKKIQQAAIKELADAGKELPDMPQVTLKTDAKAKREYLRLQRQSYRNAARMYAQALRRAKVWASPEFQEWFGDSKAVDEDGLPLVLYHGTTKGGWDEVNPLKLDLQGFYTTDNAMMASTYSRGSYDDITPTYMTSPETALKAIIDNGAVVELFDFDKYETVKTIKTIDDFRIAEKDVGGSVGFIAQYPDDPHSWFSFDDQSELIDAANELEVASDQTEGLYPVYVRVSNPLVIDAKGSNWDEIEYDGTTWSTRSLELHAFELQHDGLIIRNVYDNGGPGHHDGTVFITFPKSDPYAIKSIHNDGSFSTEDDSILRSECGAGSKGNPGFQRGNTCASGEKQSVGGEQTDTPEFRKWFGDSKVVDENGEPLVVYHGTNVAFDSFDPDMRGVITSANSESRKVFSFAASPSVAEWYATQAARVSYNRNQEDIGDKIPFGDPRSFELSGTNIVPVYLSAENILDVTWGPDQSVSDAIDEAIEKGLDGVVVRDIGSEQHGLDITDYWFVFSPEQIKSATGNSGAFDPDNPDITKSTGPKSGCGANQPGGSLARTEAKSLWFVSYADEMYRSDCGAGEPGNPGFQHGNTCSTGDRVSASDEITRRFADSRYFHGADILTQSLANQRVLYGGHYFTDDPVIAASYGDYVYAVDLEFGKMLDLRSIDRMDTQGAIDALIDAGVDSDLLEGVNLEEEAIAQLFWRKDVVNAIRNSGYDSIAFNDLGSPLNPYHEFTSYVIFDPDEHVVVNEVASPKAAKILRQYDSGDDSWIDAISKSNTVTTGCGAGSKGNPGFQSGNTCARLRQGFSWARHDKKKKRFVRDDGSEVTQYIPPSWTDVQVANDPDADLIAIGRDAKGRTQRIYSSKHWEKSAAKKFEKVDVLIGSWDSIGRKLRRDMDNPKTMEHAAIARLIWKTGIRPGGDKDTKAAVKAYGATTLEARHVKIDGSKVTLSYTGKKGIDRTVTVRDSKLASTLGQLIDGKGPNDRVFSVSPRSFRKYIDRRFGKEINPKDFRTAIGTMLAKKLVAKTPKPSSMKAYKAAVRNIAKTVSKSLGNTPKVALQSYIDPRVFLEIKP